MIDMSNTCLRVAVGLGLLLSAVGCTSTGDSVSQRDTLYGTQDQLWLAAQAAIRDMGGRIVSASRDSGIVVGQLDLEGNRIKLDISLSGAPGSSATSDGGDFIDISAHASLWDTEDAGPQWTDPLRRIVDEFMALVTQNSSPRR
jgi:hypothetical protein